MRHLICIFLFALGGCAAERPVDEISDVDKDRFTKAPFLADTAWLQKVTVVKAGEQPAFGFVGLQSQVQLGRFEFSRDRLKFVNTVTPYSDSAAEPVMINAWDVSHSDRRLAESGGKVTNIEEENPDLQWWEKRFFEVNWATAAISESASFPFFINKRCWSKAASNLVSDSQEIFEEHISFTIAVDYEIDENCLTQQRYNNGDLTHTLHFKYSFIPEPQTAYEPYLYTGEDDPLIAKYGYFNSVIPGLAEDGRLENKFVMNRWDPEKTHVFYFAEDFPEDYKWVFRDETDGIFPKLNKIFADNELTIRFEIRENDGSKKFGDLRYSFIKVIEELNPRAPLGYGPSDAHPLTGEIVAANSMLWTGYLKYYVDRVTDDVAREATAEDDSSLFLQLQSTLGSKRKNWTSTAKALEPSIEAGQSFRFLLPQYTYGFPGNGFANRELDPTAVWQPESLAEMVSRYQVDPDEEFATLVDKADATVAEQLDLLRTQKFDALSTTAYGWEQTLADIRSLALQAEDSQIIFNRILYATAIHEFGHNLNLRHNFYGSVDSAHFGKVNEQRAHLTSSVMDYMSLDQDDHHGFGEYDVAAMLYAYSSGEKDLAKENEDTYLYCTDQHVFVNALCNQWDEGSTPSEIALSLVDRYENLYWTRNFRDDRAYWNTSSYELRTLLTMWDFKKFVKMHEDTYEDSDFREKMSRLTFSDAELTDQVQAIQRDMKQAALISAAFYDAVMQQGFTERPFTETYDTWSGALQRKGIATDKLYAAWFLLGDTGITYNPNNGANPTSFLPLRLDDDVGDTIANIIRRNVMDSGDMYLGFDSFSRILYAQSASGYQDVSGSGSELEQLRIACFSPDSFELRFNIDDVYNYSQDGEPAHVISYEIINLDDLDDSADYYFRSGTSQIAVININGNFYVSSLERNPLSYELIQSQVRHEILELYMVYRLITEGRIPECT